MEFLGPSLEILDLLFEICPIVSRSFFLNFGTFFRNFQISLEIQKCRFTGELMSQTSPDTASSLEKRSEAVPHEVGHLFSKEETVLGRRLGHKFPGEPTFLNF